MNNMDSRPPGDSYFKWLPVARLKELLAKLPDDFLLAPNDVKNLAIFKPGPTPGEAGEFIGAIDFLLEGEIERYDEEK